MNQSPITLPPRASNAHKGSFGRVLLVGGSRGMSGAIAMSAMAALKSGAGLVSAAVPDRCLETVASFHPSIMTIALPDTAEGTFDLSAASSLNRRKQPFSAIGCGPGMTTSNGSTRMVERLLHQRSVARVFDADALNCLAVLLQSDSAGLTGDLLGNELKPESNVGPWGPIVLTPHPGELQRLTGVASSDRTGQLQAAGTLSRSSGAVIVVKGGPTTVVHHGSTWTNSTGNPGMATAGSGDVLTGVIASLLGQGLSPWEAARLGVWVHGAAGDLAADRVGPIGMTAMEILEALPQAMKRVMSPENDAS
ncbi:MAG: NAD(P)H-hydrate dehydratase [Planctomycetota bacterium]